MYQRTRTPSQRTAVGCGCFGILVVIALWLLLVGAAVWVVATVVKAVMGW